MIAVLLDLRILFPDKTAEDAGGFITAAVSARLVVNSVPDFRTDVLGGVV